MQANIFKRSAITLAVIGAFAAGTVIADRAATIKPAGAATQSAAGCRPDQRDARGTKSCRPRHAR